MTRQASWKSRSLRGGLTGGVLFGVAVSLAVLLIADDHPTFSIEDLDPFFFKHAMLVLLPFGAYCGAVLGGVMTNPTYHPDT